MGLLEGDHIVGRSFVGFLAVAAGLGAIVGLGGRLRSQPPTQPQPEAPARPAGARAIHEATGLCRRDSGRAPSTVPGRTQPSGVGPAGSKEPCRNGEPRGLHTGQPYALTEGTVPGPDDVNPRGDWGGIAIARLEPPGVPQTLSVRLALGPRGQ